MNKSLLALALLVGLTGGRAAAKADEATVPSPQTSVQLSQRPAPLGSNIENQGALHDYRANINPNSNLPSAGVYDQSDRFQDPTGRPLPGWGSLNGEGAADF